MSGVRSALRRPCQWLFSQEGVKGGEEPLPGPLADRTGIWLDHHVPGWRPFVPYCRLSLAAFAAVGAIWAAAEWAYGQARRLRPYRPQHQRPAALTPEDAQTVDWLAELQRARITELREAFAGPSPELYRVPEPVTVSGAPPWEVGSRG